MFKFHYFRLLFLALLIACQQNSDISERPSTKISVATEPPKTITTKPLSPQPIRINLEELPQPFHSDMGNTDEVRRYSYNNQQQLTGTGEKIAELPGGGYNQVHFFV